MGKVLPHGGVLPWGEAEVVNNVGSGQIFMKPMARDSLFLGCWDGWGICGDAAGDTGVGFAKIGRRVNTVSSFLVSEIPVAGNVGTNKVTLAEGDTFKTGYTRPWRAVVDVPGDVLHSTESHSIPGAHWRRTVRNSLLSYFDETSFAEEVGEDLSFQYSKIGNKRPPHM